MNRHGSVLTRQWTRAATAPAAVTIALGVAAATLLFAVVKAVLLNPLPYPEADRLAWIASIAGNEPGRTSIPDFDDYFGAAQAPSYCDTVVRLSAESSRGCWWGAKSHCTFCGLNGGTMAFRAKSAERFAAYQERHAVPSEPMS